MQILRLDVISSNPNVATTYTPVRRGLKDKLEYQFNIGINLIKFSSQSRITGEGTSTIGFWFKIIYSVKTCSTVINVEDNSPPVAKTCPKGIIRHSELNKRFKYNPRFQDNTGIVKLDVSGSPGMISLFDVISIQLDFNRCTD